MERIKQYIISHQIDLGLTLGSIILTCLMHWLGFFDFLELKTYDYRFNNVRGPITGWRASDSTIIKLGNDVVLVDVNDETWRILSESNIIWPYPRGDIWAKVINNLSKSGAKVIGFDIQFDSPDARSTYLRGVSNKWPSELRQFIPGHGDVILSDAIRDAQLKGTRIVMNTKMVREPLTIPPQYIAKPVKLIMEADPSTGLINDIKDIDNFSREYSIAGYFDDDTERKKPYFTLGLRCAQQYYGISDTAELIWDRDNLLWTLGPISIPAHGKTNNFLVNYYGPPSGMKLANTDYPPWNTFPRFSLYQILDTKDFELPGDNDLDWMSQFMPGEVPSWILAIENAKERNEMMKVMNIGAEFDIKKSPFYNKVVIIGASVEVLHDVKSTPFYNYLGQTQDTPGMETHANAIQTILHDNYLNIFGGRTTRLLSDGRFYPIAHFLIISILCIIAYFIFRKLDIHPVLAGTVIILEILIYVGLALGLFANDIWWMLKTTIANIVPHSVHNYFYDSLLVSLPEPGKTYVMPIIAPLAGVFLTYGSNVIFQFLHEQKDKKFLKETFGTYISPDLIDEMYEQKQAPKLGGVQDYHTAFFSDIQDFSTFSEKLEPEKMVRLMNEYLTEMTDILLKHQGTLDKYIGDAIVAFYGAPAPVQDQEKKACSTALGMREGLNNLRNKWKVENDWPEVVYSMQHRIGLNSGEMVTGNMGSQMRMNYTMMGDTVNLAARLEPAAKQYGVYIIVGENIYKATNDDYVFRFLDFLGVKGKNIPVRTYELIDIKDQINKTSLELIETFEKGLDFYFNQDWENALEHFEKSKLLEDDFTGRNTNPSQVFIKRCNHFSMNPPPDDWDGVWRMTTK